MNGTENDSSGVDIDRVFFRVYFTSSVLTFIECLFAVYLTKVNDNLRRRPSKYFSYNLVLSVGLLSFISLVYGACLFNPSVSQRTIAGCAIKIVQRCMSVVSCLSLTCLALDRYVSICWPLRYFLLVTERRSFALSILCWVLGFLLLLLPCANQLPTICNDIHSYIIFLASYLVVYNISTVIMLVFYILVTREFSHHAKRKHPNRFLAEAEEIRMKTARSTLRVLLLYSLLSLPHMILPLVKRVFNIPVHPALYHSCHLLHRLHLLLFLPMYVWANADSHDALTASSGKIWDRVKRCLCYALLLLYEFFCCPSESSSKVAYDEELSQMSAVTVDTLRRERI